MIEFYIAKSKLDEIAARIQRNTTKMQAAGVQISNAVNDLTQMQADYGAIVTEINGMASANPDDAVWQQAKAELDKLVAEFNTAKADAEAKQTVFDNA